MGILILLFMMAIFPILFVVLVISALPVILCVATVMLIFFLITGKILSIKGLNGFTITVVVVFYIFLILAMFGAYTRSSDYQNNTKQREKVYVCEVSKKFVWHYDIEKGSLVYLVPNRRKPVDSEVYITNGMPEYIYFKTFYFAEKTGTDEGVLSEYPFGRWQTISGKDFQSLQKRNENWPLLSFDEVIQEVDAINNQIPEDDVQLRKHYLNQIVGKTYSFSPDYSHDTIKIEILDERRLLYERSEEKRIKESKRCSYTLIKVFGDYYISTNESQFKILLDDDNTVVGIEY